MNVAPLSDTPPLPMHCRRRHPSICCPRGPGDTGSTVPGPDSQTRRLAAANQLKPSFFFAPSPGQLNLPHRYNLFLLVAKPGSVALVMLTWCRLVRVLRCAEHAHALQVVTHALFKERDVARLSSWGSTLWWCVVPLWAMWGE